MGSVRQIKVTVQGSGLCNLIPEVLNVAIPELSDLGLIGCSSCAVDESEAFDFDKRLGVRVAVQLRWWTGTKFVSMCQGKGSDVGPLNEIGGREVRRSQLIASRLGCRHKGRKSHSRSIAAAQRQNRGRNGFTNLYSICFILPVRNLLQILLQLRVERRGKRRIDRNQDVMGRLVCRSLGRCSSRDMREAYCIRLESSVDVIDGVEDGGVQYGKVASRVYCGRLGARGSDDRQKSPVPFDDRVDRFGRGGWMIVVICFGDVGEDGYGTPETET